MPAILSSFRYPKVSPAIPHARIRVAKPSVARALPDARESGDRGGLGEGCAAHRSSADSGRGYGKSRVRLLAKTRLPAGDADRPRFPVPFLWSLLALLAWSAIAPRVHAQRETLGVLPVKVLPAVAARMAQVTKGFSVDQMSQSLSEQFVHSVQASRRFQVVVRSDLQELVTDDEKARAFNPDKAKGFNLADTKYLTVLTIDDYEDQTQRLEQKISNSTLTKRTIRLSLITKIYDATSGKLLESAAKSIRSTDAQQTLNDATNDAEPTDALIRSVVKEAADWAASRLVDALFPVKVIAKTGKTVTINRGDGSGVAADQVWRVFSVGKVLIDPDTQEVLGKEEADVGKVRITDVLPKFSRALIVDDRGIAEGAILRQ